MKLPPAHLTVTADMSQVRREITRTRRAVRRAETSLWSLVAVLALNAAAVLTLTGYDALTVELMLGTAIVAALLEVAHRLTPRRYDR